MSIDPDYPNKLVELLPENLRQDYYHNRYEWRDTHFAFFNPSGRLVYPDKDFNRWRSTLPGEESPWVTTKNAFERFGQLPMSTTQTINIAQTTDGSQTVTQSTLGGGSGGNGMHGASSHNTSTRSTVGGIASTSFTAPGPTTTCHNPILTTKNC